MFKIGTLADWFGVGLLEGIRASERCGAQGVQLYAAGELDPMTVTAEQIGKIRGTARACSQQIVALCGELGGYGLERREENAGKISYLKRTVEVAKQLDCNIVTTHIGVVPEDRESPVYRTVLEAAQEIGEFAAKNGAYIAVETGPEKIKTLKRFIEDCGQGVGINYDPANIVMVTGDDEVAGVYTAAGSIVHTHAKDGVQKEYIGGEAFYHQFAQYGLDWADLPRYCSETPLGEGAVRWSAYLSALRDIGYQGFLTVEREAKNGADDIRRAVLFLNELLKQ